MFDEIFKNIVKEIVKGANTYAYHQLEYNCHTNLTDEDMLKFHIDVALQNGDKETFLKLTKQLVS